MIMKSIICLALFLMPFISNGQQVIFCESVDKSGAPKNSSKEFTIGSKGGFIKILVKLNNQIRSKSAVIDVYNVKDGKEVFNNSIKMKLQPEVTWFYNEITFYNTGEYNVYVYDERDKLLGVGKVKINLK